MPPLPDLPDLLDTLDLDGQPCAWLPLHRLLPLERLARLPLSVRILVENVARCRPEALPTLLQRLEGPGDPDQPCEVPWQPNRLMLHDTTCLPALADFAGLRDAVAELGGDPARLQPGIDVVLTIDHSVIVERYAQPDAVEVNLDIDYRRNRERYQFIQWAEQHVERFRVVPPGTGIIHQVNMEALAEVVRASPLPGDAQGRVLLHPDDMVATDSHTPMVNALGMVAWGVGGLEGQAAMLGEPVPIVFPEVVGVRVRGALQPGVTATDVALHLTALLRRHGVVAKFVEFNGPGLDQLDLGTRATIANMAPEYGATVVYFPFDHHTMDYLRLTGRSEAHRRRIDTYLHAQGLWRDDTQPIAFDALVELDLAQVTPCVAGPHLPHQHQPLSAVAGTFRRDVIERQARDPAETFLAPEFGTPLGHGALVLAAITSCTNTANPLLMVQAGLLARRARERGLRVAPWVKTSLSPGSRVVADYLRDAGLLEDLEALGFHLVGFGCMTCIGSSGPLQPQVEALVDQGLLGAGVLSGNRNFEGRVNPKLAGAYLASPALVVAWALAGQVMGDLASDPLGRDPLGQPVYLRDLWPDDAEVQHAVRQHVQPAFFAQRNATLWQGTHHWQALRGDTPAHASRQFGWRDTSTYLRRPAYTEGLSARAPASRAVPEARLLMHLGDNVTTDHLSPVGAIPADSLAGQWLLARGERPGDLNQYSTRRSNHEVMLRGAFTTRNLRNRLVPEAQHPRNGAHAWTPDGQCLPVSQAAPQWQVQGVPLVVVAGWNYGAGSSRDWAAKAQALLGVRVVVARSFERIHRSNLIGMGVFPLVADAGTDPAQLDLHPEDRVTFEGLDDLRLGRHAVRLTLHRPDASAPDRHLDTWLAIESGQELLYLRHGGVLPYVMRRALETA
ncbi:MAG: hypothetical protein RLZZ373_1849 [Pseudomonadota bacterium]